MRKLWIIFSLFIGNQQLTAQDTLISEKFVMVIHGGAGTILKSQMTPEKEKAYQQALEAALRAGEGILRSGGTALDAVVAAVQIMEESPLFNAGRGAVFTHAGTNELDASIMNGKDLSAGSVAGVKTIKSPVAAARAVMEKSPHVMMTGAGAEEFAREQGLEIVDPSYFYTEDRYRSLERIRARDSLNKIKKSGTSLKQPENHDEKYGTVGAVALDRYGNLAAATSTGGMTNKRFGRVGDAPIIGAGTYANNQTCAISCTGWGEFFIRLVLAKSVSDLMAYKNYSIQQAAEQMVMKELPALGGDGGLIAVDKKGNISMPFNTAGMYRGYIREDGKPVLWIYGE